MDSSAADLANAQLVDRLIAEGSLHSPAVIAAFRATPRHRFLDRIFIFQRRRNRWRELVTRDPDAEQLGMLYSDRALITGLSPARRDEAPVPISSSSQPSLMAQMLQDLRLENGLCVLEVGTGTGYNAALMAHVVGPDRVISMDVDRDVLSRAWDNLRGFPERGVQLHHGDGRAGLADHAPFDRIMVTAAARDVEPAWLQQLAVGGLLVAPLVFAPGLEFVLRGRITESGRLQGRLTRAAYFMPLRAEGETGTALTDFDPPPGFATAPAPWAGWFDRRRLRTSWLGFSQSLAFLGLLRGLSIHCRGEGNTQIFGVSERSTRHACWLGQDKWHFDNDADRALGEMLWQEFLAMGGPWPTEYEVELTSTDVLTPEPGCFLHRGPLSVQRWRLIEPRERPGWV